MMNVGSLWNGAKDAFDANTQMPRLHNREVEKQHEYFA